MLNEKELLFFILSVEDHFSGKEAFILNFPSEILYASLRGYICDKEDLHNAPESILRIILAFFVIALEVKQVCSAGIEEKAMFNDVFPHLLSLEAFKFAEQVLSFPRGSAGYNLIKLNDIHKMLYDKDAFADEKLESFPDAKMPEKIEQAAPRIEADLDSYFNFGGMPEDCGSLL